MPLNIPASRSGNASPLQLALDAAGMGSWRWDAASDMVVWDDGMYRIFGLSPGSPIDPPRWLEMIHPDDRPSAVQERSAAMTAGGRFERRYRIRRTDGQERWVEALGQVFTGSAGEHLGTMGCARDVTEQVHAVDALQTALDEQQRLLHLWQEAAARTATLQMITADLATALTVEDVARFVGEHLRRTSGAANGAVAVVDDDPRYLRLEAWFGYDDAAVSAFRRHPADSRTPLATAARTGLPSYLQAHELQAEYPELADHNRRAGSASLVALPLIVAGSSLGALALGFAEPQPLDDAQRTFFELLAGQVAQAVARSLLVARLRSITHELQGAVRPSGAPAVPGLDVAADYSPGGDDLEEVGGDWYDVFALPDGRAAFVVGDVMGRGVRASTAMSRHRAQLRAFVCVDPDPVTVVGRLDRLVAEHTSDADWEDLLTLVYGIVDPAQRSVTYVNAGHPAPIVVGTDRCLPLAFETGPPVALVPGSAGLSDGLPAGQDREANVVLLAPGEMFLLYTDGLVERSWRDPDEGMALLVDGLTRTPPAQRADAAALVAAATSLDLGTSTKDDVTLLALRCI